MRGPLKLTPAEALDVYLLARSGLFYQREVGEVYGISQSAVSLIAHRRRWQWLLENQKEPAMSDDDLRAEIDKLKTRQAELEAKLAGAGEPPAPAKSEPYQPIDYTSRASMGAETMRDLASAIPDSLARDLRADLARGNPVTQSPAQLVKGGGERVQIERGTGWAAPNPITPPAGVPIMDRLMDMQDAIDKADLQRRLAGSKK
jgi:hypothetical protein